MGALLTALPGLISAGKDIFSYIQGVRKAAQQSGEWTPELEQQFQDALTAANLKDHWQPEGK